jgi:hypothetical protein
LLSTASDLDIDIQGFDLMLVGTLPIGEKFYGFAKAGVLFWDVEADLDIREETASGVITSTASGDDSANPAARLRFQLVNRPTGQTPTIPTRCRRIHFRQLRLGFIAASRLS